MISQMGDISGGFDIMKRVLVRMDDITHEKAKDRARAEGLSLNSALVGAIGRWLGPFEAIQPAVNEDKGLVEAQAPEGGGEREQGDSDGQSEPLLEKAVTADFSLIQDILHGRTRMPKLVSAPRAEEVGVPNCPVCATDMVEVEVRGSMVCPRCAAG